MKNIIITGASYGLGYSIAKIVGKSFKDSTLHLISRTLSDEVKEVLSKNSKIFYYRFDLQNSHKISDLMKDIFNNIDIATSDSILLINNAAILEPIKFSGDYNSSDIIKHINVNITAPMIMSSEFIDYLKNFNKDKKIINISSGAGKHPYIGWSLYCSSKASLDMFTQNLALEQETLKNGVKILSFAPGIVETQMQELIRKQNKKDFPLVDKFKDLHKSNLLLSPDYVAKYLIDNFIKNDFINGMITDIRG